MNVRAWKNMLADLDDDMEVVYDAGDHEMFWHATARIDKAVKRRDHFVVGWGEDGGRNDIDVLAIYC